MILNFTLLSVSSGRFECVTAHWNDWSGPSPKWVCLVWMELGYFFSPRDERYRLWWNEMDLDYDGVTRDAYLLGTYIYMHAPGFVWKDPPYLIRVMGCEEEPPEDGKMMMTLGWEWIPLEHRFVTRWNRQPSRLGWLLPGMTVWVNG